MSEKTSTLAVGGVAAGEILSGDRYDRRVCVCRIPPVNAADFTKAPVLLNSTVKHSVYKLMELKWCRADDVRSFVFWADSDEIRDEFDLLNALANGYRPVHQETT